MWGLGLGALGKPLDTSLRWYDGLFFYCWVFRAETREEAETQRAFSFFVMPDLIWHPVVWGEVGWYNSGFQLSLE